MKGGWAAESPPADNWVRSVIFSHPLRASPALTLGGLPTPPGRLGQSSEPRPADKRTQTLRVAQPFWLSKFAVPDDRRNWVRSVIFFRVVGRLGLACFGWSRLMADWVRSSRFTILVRAPGAVSEGLSRALFAILRMRCELAARAKIRRASRADIRQSPRDRFPRRRAWRGGVGFRSESLASDRRLWEARRLVAASRRASLARGAFVG